MNLLWVNESTYNFYTTIVFMANKTKVPFPTFDSLHLIKFSEFLSIYVYIDVVWRIS